MDIGDTTSANMRQLGFKYNNASNNFNKFRDKRYSTLEKNSKIKFRDNLFELGDSSVVF